MPPMVLTDTETAVAAWLRIGLNKKKDDMFEPNALTYHLSRLAARMTPPPCLYILLIIYLSTPPVTKEFVLLFVT